MDIFAYMYFHVLVSLHQSATTCMALLATCLVVACLVVACLVVACLVVACFFLNKHFYSIELDEEGC